MKLSKHAEFKGSLSTLQSRPFKPSVGPYNKAYSSSRLRVPTFLWNLPPLPLKHRHQARAHRVWGFEDDLLLPNFTLDMAASESWEAAPGCRLHPSCSFGAVVLSFLVPSICFCVLFVLLEKVCICVFCPQASGCCASGPLGQKVPPEGHLLRLWKCIDCCVGLAIIMARRYLVRHSCTLPLKIKTCLRPTCIPTSRSSRA